jgi:outer membrane protein W
MSRGACERAALVTAAAWLCSGYWPTAQAQTPTPAAPTGRREASVDFNIPSQPMASALNSWAVQANAQVFVDPAPVAHLIAPAVSGSLTPRQALRVLLAHTNLEVAQGANGVFVIKPRPPALAARPAPPTPAVSDDAAPVAPPPRQSLTARASAGPWLFGIFAQFARDSGTATGGASGAIAGEYFITDHVAAALALTAPRSHSFDGSGSQDTPAQRASAHLQSSAVMLKYYFAPENRLRPYLGAGIAVTALYDSSAVAGLDRVTVGPAVVAGLDVTLNPHWMFRAELGWEQVRPALAAGPGGDIRLDPVQFGLGFVYRFGGAIP